MEMLLNHRFMIRNLGHWFGDGGFRHRTNALFLLFYRF
ncbi:hypothetical protein LPLWJ_21410 [Lactiplantibacillus plantarum WJL]|nr:hypothetical protein LPLWJ_21410 [Lactiplantibacillus plantarum WJL]